MTESTQKKLENIIFENRACSTAECPRLHMKEPEKFKYTYIRNSEPITREICLAVGYHHGLSRHLKTDKWFLEINIYKVLGKPLFADGKQFYRELLYKFTRYGERRFNLLYSFKY